MSQVGLHIKELKACRQCPNMVPPVVVGQPVKSKVLLVGQAPGVNEGDLGKPFAWTAGKTLFKWFDSIGMSEEEVRERVYFAAVCRCFPGKNPKGGDRVPDSTEIEKCQKWLKREIELLKPSLVIPVGKLAILQFTQISKLTEAVGTKLELEKWGNSFDMISLPHPSGASTWHRTQPGKDLLSKALRLIKNHSAYKGLDPS